MDKSTFLRDIADRICANLPDNLGAVTKDIEKNIHAVLQTAFAKLELVTREEFDTQAKVLARTREKIEALETKVQAMEEQERQTRDK